MLFQSCDFRPLYRFAPLVYLVTHLLAQVSQVTTLNSTSYKIVPLLGGFYPTNRCNTTQRDCHHGTECNCVSSGQCYCYSSWAFLASVTAHNTVKCEPFECTFKSDCHDSNPFALSQCDISRQLCECSPNATFNSEPAGTCQHNSESYKLVRGPSAVGVKLLSCIENYQDQCTVRYGNAMHCINGSCECNYLYWYSELRHKCIPIIETSSEELARYSNQNFNYMNNFETFHFVRNHDHGGTLFWLGIVGFSLLCLFVIFFRVKCQQRRLTGAGRFQQTLSVVSTFSTDPLASRARYLQLRYYNNLMRHLPAHELQGHGLNRGNLMVNLPSASDYSPSEGDEGEMTNDDVPPGYSVGVRDGNKIRFITGSNTAEKTCQSSTTTAAAAATLPPTYSVAMENDP